MSKYLSIECEWFDQPVTDPVERRTWACIRISAASRSITRLWDRTSESERVTIYIPAFPLASWIVENWWTLLYEPRRSKRLPSDREDFSKSEAEWLRRHCLRSADSGLLLPQACFFNDGRDTCIQWLADEQDLYPNMPGHFVESGEVRVSQVEAELSLREFVSKVIARVAPLEDDRVVRLRENWNAIIKAEPSEIAFCRAAGRMGLDPYQCGSWESSLVSLLERDLGNDAERPIVGDFLEAAEAVKAVEAWEWVRGTELALALGKSPKQELIDDSHFSRAVFSGYQIAQDLRERAGLGPSQPVDSIEAVARKLGGTRFSFAEREHPPGGKVRAVVGWASNQEAIMAGPKPSRPDNLRFLQARGFFHAACNCGRGARLITDAYTWDQQAARAFAAELLAPRTALASEAALHPGDDVIERLSEKYAVSALLVEHQLENANISSGAE